MKRSEKIFFVDNLTAELQDAKSVVLIDPTSLKVSQQQTLRRRLKEVGATLLVAKNTLLLRALRSSLLKSKKSKVEDLKSNLFGQTAIVTAQEDELAPLQALGKFIREFELPKFKIGIVGGNIQDSTQLLSLSRLPGREALAGQAVGVLMGPLYGIVGGLQGKLQELVYTLSEYKSKRVEE